MRKTMSMEAIKHQYTGEWVLIAYTELNEEMGVIRGKVLAHSTDRDEIYRQLLTLKRQHVAIEYMGEVPTDFAVVL